jgi:hypothetical protein
VNFSSGINDGTATAGEAFAAGRHRGPGRVAAVAGRGAVVAAGPTAAGRAPAGRRKGLDHWSSESGSAWAGHGSEIRVA